jgi:uncharacterized membrane protein
MAMLLFGKVVALTAHSKCKLGLVMSAAKTTVAFGRRVYSLGVMAVGTLCLVWGDFVPGQPVPRDFPARTALAYVAGAFMFLAATAIQWRRTTVWGAAGLTAYYTLIVVILMNGRLLLTHYAEYGMYSGGIAEQLVIAAGGVIIYAATASISAITAKRLTRVGQLTFGVCALLFGGAHFVYRNLTSPLVPKWLPPTQNFWAYATGLGFIAAGVAILTGVQARLAAILLTFMLASFAILVHTPMLLASPSNRYNWSESALNLAILGAAWVVADSLARPSTGRPGSRS